MNSCKAVAMALASACLMACGGGGGGGGGDKPPDAGDTTLSPTQKNFEASAIKDSWVRLNWLMPTTSSAPVSGTNYFYKEVFSLPVSPKLSAVELAASQVNLTSSLALPDMSKQGVIRVVKNGVIHVGNHLTRNSFSYLGSDVVENKYATDGSTLIEQIQYDDWSEAKPLTGPIGAATTLKSFYSFLRTTYYLYDFSKTWLSGASYITRKSFYVSDILFAKDWTGATYTSSVNPYAGTESTIEALFANSTYAAAGGIMIDNVLYPLAGGTISTVEGVRAWVANAKRPSGVAPTDEYVALFELNGKVYFGSVIKAGTRVRVIDGVDSTVINDYSVRLNSAAGNSIAQVFNF